MFGDAEETRRRVRHFQLGSVLKCGAVVVFGEQLVSFALADGVVTQSGHPIPREEA